MIWSIIGLLALLTGTLLVGEWLSEVRWRLDSTLQNFNEEHPPRQAS